MVCNIVSIHARRRQHGAVLVWVAIVLIVLIGFLGLALDVGYAYYTGQKLQNAADAAALAGAYQISFGHDSAELAAIEIAAANEAGGDPVQLASNPDNDADGDVVMGIYDASDRSFTPSVASGQANAIRVVARRTTGSPGGPLPLFLGSLMGTSTVDLSRWAIAVAEGGPAYADIIALNDSDPLSFYVYGFGNLDLGDGQAQVNSTSNKAAMFQGHNITYTFGETSVTGAYDERGNPTISWPDIVEGQNAVPDPLANLPEPDPAAYTRYEMPITGTGQFYPGYYPHGLDLMAGDNVILNPGVYILDNGFEINGHATLTGSGVMFFLRTGSVIDNGTGQAYLTPPVDGVYQGIQFFQARNNTTMARFNGGTIWDGAQVDDPSTPDVDESTAGTGSLYFPDASVELGGNGTMRLDGLIADKVVVYGNGQKTMTGGWDGDEGTEQVYLVE